MGQGLGLLLPEDHLELVSQAMEANAHDDLFAKYRGVAPKDAPQESATEHAWAPEEDASLPEEHMVELLVTLEEDKKDDAEEELQAFPPPAASRTAAQTMLQSCATSPPYLGSLACIRQMNLRTASFC